MGKETSKRIQTSILNGIEKKTLVWLAQRQPQWMTSDTLTYIGVLGVGLYMLGGRNNASNVSGFWAIPFTAFFTSSAVTKPRLCRIWL